MISTQAHERDSPSRWQALAFQLKTRLFQIRRAMVEISSRPPLHPQVTLSDLAPIVVEKRSPLWKNITPAEFPLTAGKVENLRAAARILNRTSVPANQTFSFWRQLGRTKRSRGFTTGRELREGCLVPALGGGLCQLSGLLYQAALDSGLHIVERHAHSRVVPGSSAEKNLDATVFWNYVDLRFAAPFPWLLEVELTPTDLVVRIRADTSEAALKSLSREIAEPPAPRAAPSGDCLTCGMVSCFRHPSAIAAHAPSLGHSTFLLDAVWPEFDKWCGEHSRGGDHWFIPLDGQRWKKPNYLWHPPSSTTTRFATSTALVASFRHRRLPAQGPVRQRSLLDRQRAIARHYRKQLSPECRHLVISQGLLPFLWLEGACAGRTFDVLMERWPIAELQKILDAAKSAHPQSSTLADFRADPALVAAESAALAAAARLITPHTGIAERFHDRSWKIAWTFPAPITRNPSAAPSVFFPASRLARKGAIELANAFRSIQDIHLLVLGRATEGHPDPFEGIPWSAATVADLASAHLLVIPAWVEHSPRLALLALASGIPVIATRACGLPEHPLLTRIDHPAELPAALHDQLAPVPST
ncbi:VanW family protein [Luteolibacter pohnpeiensis]|uniref:VanW family protein n=1 Tax=Luteolibacter pohnpeiensis TaxID=454153 RepID=A0A934S477_9BACT|nr:VanW family protein [Luteolibacter pohnpeiensis]MBK1881608.1 VanW family protein [Luteolibacter pohnpeiensis]